MDYSHHDDVIKWKHFLCYWPFVWGIHRSPVNSPHNGQWRGALMFSLICTWINAWVNNREAGDLRCHCADYDVTVMQTRHPIGGGGLSQYKDVVLPVELFRYKDKTVLRSSYLCNGNLHTWKDGLLYIKTSPDYFYNIKVEFRERNGVSHHRQLDSLLNDLFRLTTKKTSKPRIAGRLMHMSQHCHCRDVCKISLRSVGNILNQSTANFNRISSSIEIPFVGRAPGLEVAIIVTS